MKKGLTSILVIVRGGGELGTAVACALWRSCLRVLLLEQEAPTTPVSPVFADAIAGSEVEVEGVIAQRADHAYEFPNLWGERRIPVFVDPRFETRGRLRPDIVVDTRDATAPADTALAHAMLILALGRSATVGKEVHGVVGTGRNAGVVSWTGLPAEGHPGRILAPAEGEWRPECAPGEHVTAAAVIGTLGGQPVGAGVDGRMRGVRPAGTVARKGDPLAQVAVGDEADCPLDRVTVPARAAAGGVLEALLSVYHQAT